jgi:hypothetical protein
VPSEDAYWTLRSEPACFGGPLSPCGIDYLLNLRAGVCRNELHPRVTSREDPEDLIGKRLAYRFDALKIEQHGSE